MIPWKTVRPAAAGQGWESAIETLCGAIQEAVALLDEQGAVRAANPAFRALAALPLGRDLPAARLFSSPDLADHPELASFVKQYVADAKADGTMDVLSQKPAKVGGQDAVVLTLQDKAEGTGELQYLTARPGYVLFVAGPNSNDPSRAAIAATAEKIAFK